MRLLCGGCHSGDSDSELDELGVREGTAALLRASGLVVEVGCVQCLEIDTEEDPLRYNLQPHGRGARVGVGTAVTLRGAISLGPACEHHGSVAGGHHHERVEEHALSRPPLASGGCQSRAAGSEDRVRGPLRPCAPPSPVSTPSREPSLF